MRRLLLFLCACVDVGVVLQQPLQLLSMQAEGACTRIYSGVDANKSGVLDENERAGSELVCPPEGAAPVAGSIGVAPATGGVLSDVYFGAYQVLTQADADALAGYRVVVGRLEVHADAPITLPNTVERVSGCLDVSNVCAGDAFSFTAPGLVETECLAISGCQSAQATLAFPVLARVSELAVAGAGLQLDFPALRTVSGYMTFANAELDIFLPVLEHVAIFSALASSSATFAAPQWTVSDITLNNAPDLECAAYVGAGRALAQGLLRNVDLPYTAACAATDYCTPLNVAGLGELRLCLPHQSWLESRALCQSAGRDLLYLTSQAELDALLAARADGPLTSELYVGASDAQMEGSWRWVSGPGGNTFFPASIWAAGAPSGSADDYGLLSGFDGLLNDTDGDSEHRALCR